MKGLRSRTLELLFKFYMQNKYSMQNIMNIVFNTPIFNTTQVNNVCTYSELSRKVTTQWVLPRTYQKCFFVCEDVIQDSSGCVFKNIYFVSMP